MTDIKGYINTRRKSLEPVGRPPQGENEACPKFIAYAMEDSYVDASYELEELIQAILSDKAGEDVVIWSEDRIVAVIINNKVTRFFNERK